MRIIKFRAVSLCKGERFVYGDLRHYNRNPRNEKWTIYEPDTGIETDIDETTIGQFTGLKDKNGKEIYEGDIVRWQYLYNDPIAGWYGWSKSWLCEVKFEYGTFCIDEYPYVLGKTLDFDDGEDWRLEVIGNIHEKEYQDEQ